MIKEVKFKVMQECNMTKLMLEQVSEAKAVIFLDHMVTAQMPIGD